MTAGLPTTPAANPFVFNPSIVLADPTKAPYGFAAQTVLHYSPWNAPLATRPPRRARTRIPASAASCLAQTPSLGIFEQGNIGLTYSAVKGGAYKSGFVAQSQVCKANTSGVKTFTGFHHTYAWNDPTYPHGKINQWGITITSAAAGTELANFLLFLNSAAGQAIIKSYCYSLS